MNYIDAIAMDIAREVDDPNPTENDMRLYRIYGLLTLTVGEDVTLEHVHDAWSAWRSESAPAHPSIVWFSELTPEVQALDQSYADAIAAVAHRMEVPAR